MNDETINGTPAVIPQDNGSAVIPPTVIAPREAVNQTEVHQYVAALIEVWKQAQGFAGKYDELDDVLNEPILKTMPPENVLAIIDACLNMALPGAPLYARGVGVVTLTFPGGQVTPAIELELFPGKQVLFAMHRKTAEDFEKLLKTAIDEHFGRIIRP